MFKQTEQRTANDVDEASMECFPASDPPAGWRGTRLYAQSEASLPQIDERFWRAAIIQRPYYRWEIGYDRYLWALRFGQWARKRHGGRATFDEVSGELEAGWKMLGSPARLTWKEARDVVRDSWDRAGTLPAEAIAGRAGAGDHANAVRRNFDKSNN